MTRKLFFALMALALAVLACNFPSRNLATATPSLPPAVPTDTLPPTPVPTDTPLPTASPLPITPQPGGLTLEMLKNATVHAPSYDRTVKLTDGSYSEGTSTTTYTVRMLDVYDLGDMNGDGKDDAAIILAENGGGSGVFESLLVMTNQGGLPHQAGEAFLGDRVHINSVDIYQNVVHLDMLVAGPNDGLCCPSQPETQNYWLFGSNLFLMRLTTTAGDTERIITINEPAHWSVETNPFTVSGSETVMPFESTLVYRIYKIDGTQVNEGSLMATQGTGTTANFTQTFNLSSAGITDWVILQFLDLSAADGSTIAMGSVILKAP
jgi:hypothetical protein